MNNHMGPILAKLNGGNGTDTSHLGPEPTNGHSPRKRNKVGIVSSDPALIGTLGNDLTNKGFDVTNITIDDVANDNSLPQNFYFVDVKGLGDYSVVRKKIRALREGFPDSELVLLLNKSMISSPQIRPFQFSIDKHLVPTYTRPEEGYSGVAEYRNMSERLVRHVHSFLSQPFLIKVGGSMFDLYNKNPEVLMNLLAEIDILHKKGYSIILTTGGGPRQDTERDVSEAYGTTARSGDILTRQAGQIAEMMGIVADYVPPEQMHKRRFDGPYLNERIPVLSLSGIPDIPENESDKHTLAVGERLKVYKVVFAKHTDGVYERDPLKEPRRKRILGIALDVEDNKFFPSIYASDIMSGVINRTGSEGRGEHLIEDGALYFLKDATRFLRAVQVINGTKPKLLGYALDGERYTTQGLQKVLNNQTLLPEDCFGSFILRG